MISFYRICKFAAKDFWRNIWLSFVTTSILTLAFISVNVLFVLNLLAHNAISAVEERVDVSVYLVPGTSEEVIKTIRSYLLAQQNVKEVQLTSADEALVKFRERHADNSAILQSLNNLEKNPLGPSLSVRARSPEDYAVIMRALENPAFASAIAEKNYDDHRLVIEHIQSIARQVERGALAISILFLVIAILIVFNSIRVAIYTHREEIGIMKLVGASNFFIRMPFVVEGISFCILGLLIAAAIVLPGIRILSPAVVEYFGAGGNSDLFAYYKTHAIQIFGIQLLGGMILTAAASGIAVGKYLRR